MLSPATFDEFNAVGENTQQRRKNPHFSAKFYFIGVEARVRRRIKKIKSQIAQKKLRSLILNIF